MNTSNWTRRFENGPSLYAFRKFFYPILGSASMLTAHVEWMSEFCCSKVENDDGPLDLRECWLCPKGETMCTWRKVGPTAAVLYQHDRPRQLYYGTGWFLLGQCLCTICLMLTHIPMRRFFWHSRPPRSSHSKIRTTKPRPKICSARKTYISLAFFSFP